MLAGASWAIVPAVLKVTRNVSEVISTIMMNAIAAGTVAYMVNRAGNIIKRAGPTTTDMIHAAIFDIPSGDPGIAQCIR